MSTPTTTSFAAPDLKLWIAGARPRTLPAAIAPVIVGTAVAANITSLSIPILIATLSAALWLQIAANFLNDYSDGKRGNDTHDRMGPARLTAQGIVAPHEVLRAAYIAIAIASLAGLYVAIVTGWQLFVVGLISIAAAALYTGGPRPYGYLGMGEVFVFIFFGLVAVCGTIWAQTGALPIAGWMCAISMGMLASAILVVNNLRDRPTDLRVGKRTLAVLIGDRATRGLYLVMVSFAFLSVLAGVIIGALPILCITILLVLPIAYRLLKLIRGGLNGPRLNLVLGATARLQLLFAVALCVGLLL